MLLHEVDHRVKNNLQIVAALISVQALRIPDPIVKAALHSMLSRIEALSTVHRRLYQADDVSRFDVAAFAHDLVGATGREDIKVKLDLEPVEVPASQAAPLALVVNELVTNSLKHAFTGGRGGAIGVQVAQRDGDLRLEIADDGVCLAGSEPKPTSFGRNLIRTLARQLDATTVWHDANPGTRVEIRLPMAPDRRNEASSS